MGLLYLFYPLNRRLQFLICSRLSYSLKGRGCLTNVLKARSYFGINTMHTDISQSPIALLGKNITFCEKNKNNLQNTNCGRNAALFDAKKAAHAVIITLYRVNYVECYTVK
jgi:hypothetical protein